MGLWSDIVRRGTTGDTRNEDSLQGMLGVMTYDDCEFIGIFGIDRNHGVCGLFAYNVNLCRFYRCGDFDEKRVKSIRPATKTEISVWRNTIGRHYKERYSMSRMALCNLFNFYFNNIDITTNYNGTLE